MYARVTYVQKTKNPEWDVVHCINSATGKVAIALCKTGVQYDDQVLVRRNRNSFGDWCCFATVKEG